MTKEYKYWEVIKELSEGSKDVFDGPIGSVVKVDADGDIWHEDKNRSFYLEPEIFKGAYVKRAAGWVECGTDEAVEKLAEGCRVETRCDGEDWHNCKLTGISKVVHDDRSPVEIYHDRRWRYLPKEGE